MSNVTRAKVELRPSKYKSQDEQFKEMLHVFKRRCNEANILHAYKEHEFFVSKSERNRKKKREAEAKAKKERQEQNMRANGVAPRSKKKRSNND